MNSSTHINGTLCSCSKLIHIKKLNNVKFNGELFQFRVDIIPVTLVPSRQLSNCQEYH